MALNKILYSTVIFMGIHVPSFVANAAERIYPGSMCVTSGKNASGLGLSLSAIGSNLKSKNLRVDCPIIMDQRASPDFFLIEVWTREPNGKKIDCTFYSVEEFSDSHRQYRSPLREIKEVSPDIYQHGTGIFTDIGRGYYYIGCDIPPNFESILTHYVVSTK